MAFSFNLITESNLVAVMGILNLSPDSFYYKSRCSSVHEALKTSEQMIDDGAHIIDVGAASTRPGASEVPAKVQIKRLLPVISSIVREFNTPVSIDTFDPDVASAVLQEGATIINDVSGLIKGDKIARIVALHGAGLVLMHMKGIPKTMQDNPKYKNVVMEVLSFLRNSIAKAEAAGINPDSIAVDPGIGFGKNLRHNLELIGNLNQFKKLNKQILLGVSRKSFIGKILDLEVEDRLEGSLAAAIVGAINGANILRVHDVKATVRALLITQNIMRMSE